mgnify:CR=1 FL=1
MRCAHVGRSKQVPFRSVPELGQSPENLGQREPSVGSKEPADVLQQDESRSHHAKHALELGPEPSNIVGTFPRAGEAHGLTGKTAAHEIHGGERLRLRCDGAHVVKALCVGPVLGEHLAAPRVALDLPQHAASGGVLETQFQATYNAREKRSNRLNLGH